MKKTGIHFLVFFIFLYSCRQHESSRTGNNTAKNDTTHFFQVTQFIQSQIAEVNKTPYFIYKKDIINGEKYSVPVNTAVFNQAAAKFLKPDINDKKIKKFYTENIFHDQTTKSFTISYTSSNKELEVQNVEVMLQEDGKTVKRIFIRKFFNYPDSSAIEQLSWKPGESLQINRLVQKDGNQETAYQTDVIWNEKN